MEVAAAAIAAAAMVRRLGDQMGLPRRKVAGPWRRLLRLRVGLRRGTAVAPLAAAPHQLVRPRGRGRRPSTPYLYIISSPSHATPGAASEPLCEDVPMRQGSYC